MKRDRAQHHRRTIRLRGYDYTQAGAYFVTIVAQGRECLFGEVVDGDMRFNDAGRIVHDEWMKSAIVRPRITLDLFVVMPNHMHGIIVLGDDRGVLCGRGTARRAPTGEQFGRPTTGSLPTIVRSFESATTKRINESRGTSATTVWQRNYYEHTVRKEESLHRIRRYVQGKPMRWTFDRENPQAGVAEPEAVGRV